MEEEDGAMALDSCDAQARQPVLGLRANRHGHAIALEVLCMYDRQLKLGRKRRLGWGALSVRHLGHETM